MPVEKHHTEASSAAAGRSPGWNRRKFLRTTGLGAAGLASAAALGRPAGKKRPNVIVIIADDLGYADLGCYGSEVPTPNIDSLARRGLRFTQHYGGSAVCSPSRASLLTGLYPHQAGMGWYGAEGEGLRPPGPYQGYFNENCVTMAEVLKLSGYRTYMSGKWHLGASRPHWPVDRGFDRYFGLLGGAANYFDITKDKWPGVVRTMALDDRPYFPPKEGFYMTDAITEHAVGHLEEAGGSDNPFFLYLAYTAPHFPIHAPPADIKRNQGRYLGGWDALRRERYRRMKDLGITDHAAPLSPRDSNVTAWTETPDHDLEDLKMAIYAAQIEVMDRGVGRVLAKLKAIGQEENTMIFFTSDQGGCPGKTVGKREPRYYRPPYLGGVESYAPYGTSWANASNVPWRKFKDSLWEGGISIPLIAVCPGIVQNEGGLCRDFGHHTDFMPTILELTGADYPERFKGRSIQPMEGFSFAPSLHGGARNPRGPVFWELEGMRGMRDGNWKLVANNEGRWYLYDFSGDRSEQRDLAAAQPERVREMSAKYDAWAKRCGVKPWREISPQLRNLAPPPSPDLQHNGLGPKWES